MIKLKKFWLFLCGLVNKTRVIIETFGKPSIQMVENIKTFIDSPAADVITAIIPGQLDDLVKDKMRQYLPIVLQDLKLVDADATLPANVLVEKGIAKLTTLAPEDNQKAKQDIATKMTSYLAGPHKLDWGYLSSLIWYTYKNDFQKAA